MLHRCRPAHLLLALVLMIVPVSLAEAKAPSAPAAAQVRAPGTTATAAQTPTTGVTTPVAPPPRPASTTAAITPPPAAPAAPAPVIVTTPQQVLAGASAVLEIQNPPVGATDYRWDLDGSGSFATDTGALAHVAHVYATAGLQHVTVRIATGTGTRTVTLDVRVAPGSASQAAQSGVRSAPAGAGLLAHTSADPADTISDFQFSPATITIHVGDTITWTNNGPTAHTATASDHSFNTGILQKGQSASHTFTTAGTFAYICTLHPFMHGTVVVLAAASSTPAGGSSTTTPNSTSNSTTATTPTATPSTAGQLPLTGFDVLPRLLAGVLLLGAGVTLRRVAARR
jgi:plastocyanin